MTWWSFLPITRGIGVLEVLELQQSTRYTPAGRIRPDAAVDGVRSVFHELKGNMWKSQEVYVVQTGEVRLWKLTRHEVREALSFGRLRAAILRTGSTEPHNEHLAMEHDTASASHVACQAVRALYPRR